MKQILTIMVALLVCISPMLAMEERDGRNTVELRADAQARTELARERAEVTRERIQNAREHVQETRERMQEARDRAEDRQERFVEARSEVRACIGDDSAECVETRAEYRAHARGYLHATVERLLAHIDRIENWILNNVDAEKQEELLTELEEVRLQVEDAQAVLDGTDEEPTNEELRAAVDDVKEAWNTVKGWSKRIANVAISTKIHAASQRLDNLEDKFEVLRDRLDDAGADVTALDALLESFSNHLDDVEANWESNPEQARASFNEAVHMIREIQHELRDLRAGLRGEVDFEVSDDEVEDEANDDDMNETDTSDTDMNETVEMNETDDSTNDTDGGVNVTVTT